MGRMFPGSAANKPHLNGQPDRPLSEEPLRNRGCEGENLGDEDGPGFITGPGRDIPGMVTGPGLIRGLGIDIPGRPMLGAE